MNHQPALSRRILRPGSRAMHRWNPRCAVFAGVWLAILWVAPIDFCWSQEYVAIVLDDSGSMRERMNRSRIIKMDSAKRALIKVMKQLPSGTEVGIRLLNGAASKSHWILPIGITSEPNAIRQIESVQASGKTPLGEAMRDAADALLKIRTDKRYGLYRMIVVTDGEATDARLLNAYLPDIMSRGIRLDVIGVDMDATHSLASIAHRYLRANDDQALEKAIVEVMAESGTQNAQASTQDFELLHGLDDDTARGLLKALTALDNSAIVGKKSDRITTRTDATSAPMTPPTPSGQAPTLVSRLMMAITALLTICVVPTFVLAIIVAVLLTKLQRGRYRSK